MNEHISDPLDRAIVAANACTLFTAILTGYDGETVKHWGELPLEKKVELRDPSVVFKRGVAVCAGLVDLEQHFAQTLPTEFGIRCLKADGYSRSTQNFDSSGTIDHSWLVYSFGNTGLWAPSDPTISSNRIRDIAKKGKSFVDRVPLAMMIAIDPRLRDAFHILRFPVTYESAYKAKRIKIAEFDVTTLEAWRGFPQTNPAVCSEALTLVR